MDENCEFKGSCKYEISGLCNCTPVEYESMHMIKAVQAHEVLEAGAKHMKDRAVTYDTPSGERSISKTVSAFNSITGHSITPEQGWLFMMLLKAVRSQQGDFKMDNYEDGAAYFALMGEQANEDRN